VRRALSQQAVLALIRALVVSMVDYCATVLVGVSGRLFDRLQLVLNAAARLIFSARRSDHISQLLYDLQWLRIPERIKFRLCSLAFRFFMAQHCPILPTAFVELPARKADVICGSPLQRLWLFPSLGSPLLATTHSQWPRQEREMNFQHLSVMRRPY